jgi:phosphopantetheine--protein transferase-like protein
MRIIGYGIDLVQVGRIKAELDSPDVLWIEGVYSPLERAQADPPPIDARYYAGRFAAKEAVAKALGTGFSGEITWRGIEILRSDSGAPYVRLSGEVLAHARRMGIEGWRLSISHCGELATASAIALGAQDAVSSRIDSMEPQLARSDDHCHFEHGEGAHGRLYVVEGPDGVGKSTLAAAFFQQLQAIGVPCELMAFPGKERGTLGEHVYRLHHQPSSFGIDSIDPTSLQVLHVAAHIDALERRIKPALAAGTTIVLDRYWWSTWVYGHQLGVSHESLDAMIRLEQEHWKKTAPDAIFLVCRDLPFRAEHDPVQFHRLNELYRNLAATLPAGNVLTLSNHGTIEEEVARMLALSPEPRGNRLVAGDHGVGSPREGT